MAQGVGNNSVQEVKKNILEGTLTTEPPPGRKKLTKKERVVFDMYASARIATDWQNRELETLCQLARVTIQVRRAENALAREDLVTTNGVGTMMVHPNINVLDKLTNMKIKLERALGLNQRDVRELNRKGATYSNGNNYPDDEIEDWEDDDDLLSPVD